MKTLIALICIGLAACCAPLLLAQATYQEPVVLVGPAAMPVLPQPAPPQGCADWGQHSPCLPFAAPPIRTLLKPGCGGFTGPGCELPEPYNSNPLCHEGINLVNGVCNISTTLLLMSKQQTFGSKYWLLYTTLVALQ